jgi:alginate O-acetyltransferase complex protein AlgI
MDSASFEFVLFGLIAAFISNLSRSSLWRSVVLFATSIVFIGLLAHGYTAVILLAGFLLFNYACLVLLGRGWSGALGWFVVTVVFIYVWLKKYTFLPESIFLHSFYLTLGLSYIFFRVLHLLIETGGNREKQHISVGSYLVYTLNFTTFISGPIQRYDEFARDQFAAKPIPLGPCAVGLQLERIIRGFFKVNVLAMLCNTVHIDALAQVYQPISPSLKLYAAFRLSIVYPIFLYANFSGYIDIVIALARLMRVRLPENFNRPFSASSVIDFWNRWHITLSNWLKTYVFNPLLVTLMRRFSSAAVQPFLAVFCFFVTFFLIGLWHGRTSEFIVFGVLTGGGMSINKLWQMTLTRTVGRNGYRKLTKRPVYIALGRGLNFTWFAFTLFWFWGDWKQINSVFSGLRPTEWLGVSAAVWLAMTLVLALWEWLRETLLSIRTSQGPMLVSPYALAVYSSVLGLTSLVITGLLSQPAPPIVYKAF